MCIAIGHWCVCSCTDGVCVRRRESRRVSLHPIILDVAWPLQLGCTSRNTRWAVEKLVPSTSGGVEMLPVTKWQIYLQRLCSVYHQRETRYDESENASSTAVHAQHENSS